MSDTNHTNNSRDKHIRRPLVDIVESDDGYRIVADLPGIGEDQVELTLERNLLTLRAEVEDREPGELTAVHREYQPVVYERSFTLGASIDRDGVQATMRHGVLTLDLPKQAEAKPRQIPVSIAE